MAKFSGKFVELWSNDARALDIGEYELCASEWRKAQEGKSVRGYIIAVLLFGAGLWALIENSPIVGGVLWLIAFYVNLQSAHHALMSEVLDAQRLLAMLINGKTRPKSE